MDEEKSETIKPKDMNEKQFKSKDEYYLSKVKELKRENTELRELLRKFLNDFNGHDDITDRDLQLIEQKLKTDGNRD